MGKDVGFCGTLITIGKLAVSRGALRWFDGVYTFSSGVIEY
jgi:hypothetical protein